MPLQLFDLLANGYFPKELPPPFTTSSFAGALAGPHAVPPADAFSNTPYFSMPCVHNLVRTGGLLRNLVWMTDNVREILKFGSSSDSVCPCETLLYCSNVRKYSVNIFRPRRALMDTAKTRGRRPEVYLAYIEDRAIPAVDKGRRERRPA